MRSVCGGASLQPGYGSGSRGMSQCPGVAVPALTVGRWEDEGKRKR